MLHGMQHQTQHAATVKQHNDCKMAREPSRETSKHDTKETDQHDEKEEVTTTSQSSEKEQPQEESQSIKHAQLPLIQAVNQGHVA